MAATEENVSVLTIREVANILRCSPAHVANMLRGKVPGIVPLEHVRLGRRKVVCRSTLTRWLAAVEAAECSPERNDNAQK